MNVRLLSPTDELLFDAFLLSHRDSSMFLRANARKQGLAHGVRVGAFRDGELVGVAEHGSGGMVLVQAPEFVDELARACVASSGRPVTGLSGPLEQVRQARVALGLAQADARLQADELLYGLDLSDLMIPSDLAAGAIGWRAPTPGERDMLCDWRAAYDVEALGAADSPEQRRRAATFLDAQIADGNACVAVFGGAPVSLSALNATLPDIVQLGGIYTPPALRGRGFAKVAVAGSLLSARARGASRAVLFTSNPSAVRTYEALGFQRVGDYSLVLLR